MVRKVDRTPTRGAATSRGGGRVRANAGPPEDDGLQEALSAGRLRRLSGQDSEDAKVPVAIWLMFLAILLPVEFSLRTGAITLSPFRIVMILLFIPALVGFIQRCRFTWLDGMFFSYAIYQAMCRIINRGTIGIERGGDFLLDSLVVYLVVRAYLTSLPRIKASLRLLISLIAVLGFLAIPESITHWRFMHEIPEMLTGYAYTFNQDDDQRLGMLRASTTFNHPILFGVGAASLITYAWVIRRSIGRAVVAITGLAMGAFFSLSSAAFLTAAIAFGLLVAERSTRWLNKRSLIAVGVIIAIILFLSLASNRGPVKIAISLLTLEGQTGYFRLLIWENVIDDVLANPIFGMRPELWTRPHWMPSSIDHHWVMVALNGGLPSLIMLAIFTYATGYKILNMKMPDAPKLPEAKDDPAPTGRRKPKGQDIDPTIPRFKIDLRNAWVMTMIGIIFAGFTVAYFGQMSPILHFHLAIGTALLALDARQENEPTDARDRNTRDRKARAPRQRGRGAAQVARST